MAKKQNNDFVDPDINDVVDLNEDIISAELLEVGTVDAIAVPPLSPEDARDLTDTIRSASEMMWMLIMRAHQGRAWESLGYETWEGYVRAEFDMSRSRSYQLLDQGKVIASIGAALPDGTDVSLTEAAARDLKTVLDEILPEIRERTDGLNPEEASTVLDEIVEEQRDRLREERETNNNNDSDDDFEEYGGGGGGKGNGGDNDSYSGNGEPGRGHRDDDEDDIYDDVDDIDVTRIRRNVNAAHDVYSSLSALASLPDNMEEVIAIIPDERHVQIDTNLTKAIENLQRFRELWDTPETGNEYHSET